MILFVDKHDLVSKLINLAQELGKTPTKHEFITHIGKNAYKFQLLFGSYTDFVLAAGLEPNKDRKIDAKIFEVKSIETHLENYIPREIVHRPAYSTIAVISDIHWPFENKKVIDRYLEYVADVKPEYCILNGDAFDFYSHSRFPRSHNVFTPRDEENMARQKNEEFWVAVRDRSPKSKCVQMLGNHDVRPMRRVLETYPEAEDWIRERMNKLFTFDNVRTIFDVREELMLGDIAIFHGYRSKLGEHRDYTLYNAVNGHTHVGGCAFRRIRGQTLWELNSGLAGDPEAKGLTYTPQKISNWTSGFGAVTKLGPMFIAI